MTTSAGFWAVPRSLRGGQDSADVCGAVGSGGGPDGDKVRVGVLEGRGDLGVEMKPACTLVAAHEVPQPRFVDRKDTVFEPADALRVDVDAQYIVPQLSQARAGDEADVSDAEGDQTHALSIVGKGRG